MNVNDSPYIIGIDLGTTNSAVSYVNLNTAEEDRRIRLFKVPQLIGAGEFAPAPVLPSFLYIPGQYDIPEKSITIPWPTEDDNFAGVFARDHGSKVPARLVASAKSWLCHPNADRRAKILPWGAGAEVPRISPVQATAYYLRHIKNAWNRSRGEESEFYLENQLVTLTVPASFDESARDLTVEAAELAGIKNVILLEEPLSAFYSWLIAHEKNWSEFVRPGELILVCDVGGGTTDFTLITLREAEGGSPRFERIAVGDHLILGGDNIDLALARAAEGGMMRGRRQSLSADRWKSLCHQCRQAKEVILDGKAESRKITLMGKGKKLIADTLSTKLDREAVERIVLDGFFPVVDAEMHRAGEARKGITEFGLPYESEPAITRHLGWFLERHRQDIQNILGRDNPAPDLILFNGGSLKSQVARERIREALRHWFQMEDPESPRVLENPDPDLSVALGASYYGLVKIGKGVRVGSGSPRSYYLGVTAEARARAVCLVERGLDEGSHIELPDKTFEVLANRPVSFDLFSSSYRSGDSCGDIIEIDGTLTPLPPIQTVVQFGKKGDHSNIPVQIEADYTETGSLALWCRSRISDHRWRLHFHLRDAASPLAVEERETFDESVIDELCRRVKDAFASGGDDARLDSLVRELSDILKRPKEKWPLGVIRPIADELLKQIDCRGGKAKMESRWLNLTGFCLRPGFGDGLDAFRLKNLWKIYKNGPVHSGSLQVRCEWWILWRRVAGGLKPGQQRQIIQDLFPIMLPKKGGKPKMPPQEALEIWMAVANMEHLLVKDKIKWGRGLLPRLKGKKINPQYFWTLARLGARELLYGPVDRVIPPKEASAWLDQLLALEWTHPKPLCSAVAQMARQTGDRIRDIDPEVRDRVIRKLSQSDSARSRIQMVETVVEMKEQDEQSIFGESLPTGLVLRA